MGGISLDEGSAEIRGLKYDRRWMLIDQKGNFLTQRSLPVMARFGTEMTKKGILVRYGSSSIEIPFEPVITERIRVRIWEDSLIAGKAEEKINQWFSSRLERPCSLVIMDQRVSRPVHAGYRLDEETVSFADGFPYLIISEGSLKQLNRQLSTPVPMNRFRPNLVIDAEEAFLEDKLEEFSVGEARFRVMKPCARCVVTTTDQRTGIRSEEPLKTLSSFRKKDHKIYFGQNALCIREGHIRTGDKITVHSTKPALFD